VRRATASDRDRENRGCKGAKRPQERDIVLQEGKGLHRTLPVGAVQQMRETVCAGVLGPGGHCLLSMNDGAPLPAGHCSFAQIARHAHEMLFALAGYPEQTGSQPVWALATSARPASRTRATRDTKIVKTFFWDATVTSVAPRRARARPWAARAI
jgi:hypothetical protein